ncbi:MAG: hypothetical protein BGO31_00320 [Bacteroidetes bacterium 43-16]|uniref:hypothetical protein n=1 Tax=Bacteroidota TaxID=976 RepID=UPI000927D6D4|nr:MULTISPECIES: hypothetical protein [Bacteroidota]OJV51682.1 MAG: hypothetical protein BGO31_00320 [Bacteroidetes bacterium 43-16]
MGKPFTPERLANIRRLRKARRLYKQQPVFAFAILCAEFKDYTYEQFQDDLRIRNKSKRTKNKKSSLVRFGRYFKMIQFLELYRNTGIVDYARQAQKLRSVITKPYRVLVKIEGQYFEYGLDPTIAVKEVERLVYELKKCKTEIEADKMIEHFRSMNRIG